jgi:predicted phosphodiesterase
MERRDFLKLAGLGMASAGVIGAAAPVAPAADTPATQAATAPAVDAKIRTGPYLQNPGADSMTVMWMTSVPGYGYVEYGETQSLGRKADGYADGLVQANNLLHRIPLTSLKPRAKYFYRVCFKPTPVFRSHHIEFGPEISSEVHSFTTRDPAAKSVRFAMYNDIHDNVAMWKTLHGFVAKEKLDFHFLNGDITNRMQEEREMVELFLDPCTEMFARETPFLYARGNHETRGGYSREMKKYLALPNDSYHYAFTHGPVRFVVLDSGEDKEDSHKDYFGLNAFDAYRSMQTEFLRHEIQSDAWKNARWRIALFHIPSFRGKEAYTMAQLRKTWHPLLNDGKADLFLAGHTHRYAVIPADPAAGHNYPVVIGGGPRIGIGTVTLVEADAKNIRVKQTRDDGQQVGELVL